MYACNALTACFSSHPINKHPSQDLFCVMFCTCFVLYVSDFAVESAPPTAKCSARLLSNMPRYKKAMR